MQSGGYYSFTTLCLTSNPVNYGYGMHRKKTGTGYRPTTVGEFVY